MELGAPCQVLPEVTASVGLVDEPATRESYGNIIVVVDGMRSQSGSIASVPALPANSEIIIGSSSLSR